MAPTAQPIAAPVAAPGPPPAAAPIAAPAPAPSTPPPTARWPGSEASVQPAKPNIKPTAKAPGAISCFVILMHLHWPLDPDATAFAAERFHLTPGACDAIARRSLGASERVPRPPAVSRETYPAQRAAHSFSAERYHKPSTVRGDSIPTPGEACSSDFCVFVTGGRLV